MATRVSATGTVFQSGGASSNAAYTAVAQVRSIGDVGAESSEVECTDLDSTAKEYISGLPDTTPFDLTIAFDPAVAGHILFDTRQKSGEVDYYKIILNDTGDCTLKMRAVVKAFKITGMSPDGLIEAVATMRPTGTITMTP